MCMESLRISGAVPVKQALKLFTLGVQKSVRPAVRFCPKDLRRGTARLERFRTSNAPSFPLIRTAKAEAIYLRDALLDPSCTGEVSCRDANEEISCRVEIGRP